jgi:hypothetical protein
VSDQSEFDALIVHEVRALLGQHPHDFAKLTAALPGVYPQDVLRALHSVARQEPHVAEVAERVAASALDDPIVRSPWSGLLGLPPPHPLDFEWRFAASAVETLADHIIAVTPPGTSLAFVGTPTLAVASIPGLEPYAADYYGQDAEALATAGLTNQIRDFRVADLLREFAIGATYSTVVMDPPWYDDYLQRFLHFAASALRIGGHLLTAMPPRGTRPGIAAANREILAHVERLGFQLESKHSARLRYETPFFERNALRAAGILNVASDWRCGDLWILRKVSPPRARWPGDLANVAWSEFTFGSVRLRVDSGANSEGSDPRLHPLVEGDILPSVSRRDDRRARIRVWTTGNRVFWCEAPAQFAALVSDWQKPHSYRGSQGDAHRRTKEYLFELIDRERTELAWPQRQSAPCPID